MDRSGDGEEVIIDKVFNCLTAPARELSFRCFTQELFTDYTSSFISSVGIFSRFIILVRTGIKCFELHNLVVLYLAVLKPNAISLKSRFLTVCIPKFS